MKSTEVRSALSISTRDVGCTQVATVWIGDTRVAEFYTATAHADKSLDAAERIVADALRQLVNRAVMADAHCRFWLGEPGGFHATE